MLKRLPLLPTLIVLAAVIVMVRLGFWQIDRMHQKNAMVAEFQAALATPPPAVDLNHNQLIDYADAYSPIRVVCDRAGQDRPKAGRNAQGQTGWVHVFSCSFRAPSGRTGSVDVVGGWSTAPASVQWSGGAISGIVIPESMTDRLKWHIMADPTLAGLEANARPDPNEIPNNHWSYAIQWFLFAGVALVIYGLALRKRLRAA
ncbi:MAG: SURF1 family protein [Novosphingobium sp.]